ncbi:4Fe-4S dicluster domain-containing protein [Acetohalobium arabaticum]|uniref:4Fe-4S ferredoxin iron-sulfur binding domain protein n=1 Tax=Acetohalobium arabaticum (strain ATCC 49924 / DSM 5501 / Z-7288) TaxID=574087 RepID=D9QS39_ACEAZ|nr:4Fe-4S dicluster domain-containing protein [Acetohalobium arabaticum]ADL13330.1 4Fe-4S ferredoxin iron-sulfur binding domain protein [Acetohalobium arabaticum DSM 5501]
MKRVYAKEEYCLGCRLCEVYCVTNHSESQDIIKAHKLEKITPRVVIESKGVLSLALQCRHCEEADCTRACITGALQKDPKTGEITYDQDKCVGCWTCIMACSYGVIQRDEAGQKVISKCDLCGEEEESEPACVTNCPNGALVFEDRGE